MRDARGTVLQYGDKVLKLTEPVEVLEYDFIQVVNEIEDIFISISDDNYYYREDIQESDILKLNDYNLESEGK